MKERSRYITVDPDKSSGSDLDELDLSKISRKQLDTEASLKQDGAPVTVESESSIQSGCDKEMTGEPNRLLRSSTSPPKFA